MEVLLGNYRVPFFHTFVASVFPRIILVPEKKAPRSLGRASRKSTLEVGLFPSLGNPIRYFVIVPFLRRGFVSKPPLLSIPEDHNLACCSPEAQFFRVCTAHRSSRIGHKRRILVEQQPTNPQPRKAGPSRLSLIAAPGA